MLPSIVLSLWMGEYEDKEGDVVTFSCSVSFLICSVFCCWVATSCSVHCTLTWKQMSNSSSHPIICTFTSTDQQPNMNFGRWIVNWRPTQMIIVLPACSWEDHKQTGKQTNKMMVIPACSCERYLGGYQTSKQTNKQKDKRQTRWWWYLLVVVSDIWGDLRLGDDQVQDLYSILGNQKFKWKFSCEKALVDLWQTSDHLSKPTYAGLHIGFHLLNNVKELHIVDIIDGVVCAEDPEVLLDAVVHKRSFELRPVCLHHREQLVLPERLWYYRLRWKDSTIDEKWFAHLIVVMIFISLFEMQFMKKRAHRIVVMIVISRNVFSIPSLVIASTGSNWNRDESHNVWKTKQISCWAFCFNAMHNHLYSLGPDLDLLEGLKERHQEVHLVKILKVCPQIATLCNHIYM